VAVIGETSDSLERRMDFDNLYQLDARMMALEPEGQSDSLQSEAEAMRGAARLAQAKMNYL